MINQWLLLKQMFHCSQLERSQLGHSERTIQMRYHSLKVKEPDWKLRWWYVYLPSPLLWIRRIFILSVLSWKMEHLWIWWKKDWWKLLMSNLMMVRCWHVRFPAQVYGLWKWTKTMTKQTLTRQQLWLKMISKMKQVILETRYQLHPKSLYCLL